jgi:hypothetical protein
MRTRPFFVVTAAIEAATGLALLIAPAAVVALLIGGSADTAGDLAVARVAGIALFSIAIACWAGRNVNGEASRGLLLALLVYNGAIALLLIHAAVSSHLSAIGLWPAVGAHLGLAAWGVGSLAR